jgi:hypothetical protein
MLKYARRPRRLFSTKKRPVGLFTKAHHKDLARAKSRCSKGSTSTQNHLGKFIIGPWVFRIKPKPFSALCDPNLLGRSGLFQSFVSVKFDLGGQNKRRLLNISGSQELLGAFTARSRFSVVIPFDFGCHGMPPNPF